MYYTRANLGALGVEITTPGVYSLQESKVERWFFLAQELPRYNDLKLYGIGGIFIAFLITTVGSLAWYILSQNKRIRELEDRLLKNNEKVFTSNERILIQIERSTQIGKEQVAVNEKVKTALEDEKETQRDLLNYLKARDDTIQRGLNQ
jgi:hypothetical protein